ncbi:MAG TPA: hypothetical protein VIL46_04700 [Gemmataceae bacterium]
MSLALPVIAGLIGSWRLGWRRTLPPIAVGWASGVATVAAGVLWDFPQRVAYLRQAGIPHDVERLVYYDLQLIWVGALMGVGAVALVIARYRCPRRLHLVLLGAGLPAFLIGVYWLVRELFWLENWIKGSGL